MTDSEKCNYCSAMTPDLVCPPAPDPHFTLLAAVGHDEPTVRIRALANRRAWHTLQGHKHPLTGLAFSPDGRRLASIGFEGIVKLWDVEAVPAPSEPQRLVAPVDQSRI
jgi:WD40 repeat protein